MAVAQGYLLRLILNDAIEWIGQHDQMMMWYSEDRCNLYVTSSNKSMSGTKKMQNGNKTFTGIPTIHHKLKKNKIEFGAPVTIFEASKEQFSKQYVKEFGSVGLDK